MPQTREQHRLYMRTWREKRREQSRPPPPVQASGNPADVFREWAQDKLKIPTGPLAGQSFKIPDWQFAFVQDLFREGVREAGLSVARKNGKSGVIAGLYLAFLVGPLNRENWRGLVTSITGRLAKELRDALEQTAEASGLGGKIKVRVSPTPGVIYGARGSKLDFLAADKSTGHGSGADLALIDEAGLLQERNRSLWNAVISCISGRDGRFGAISIQGDGPLFSELADRRNEPEVAFHEYVTDPQLPIDSPLAWQQSNPGLADGIKSAAYMRDMAARVLQSPANEADFRAFDLNQFLSPSRETICTVTEWERCLRQVADLPPAVGPCIVAFDLGGSASMCAAAACWPETGRLETAGAFPGMPSLAERGITDGVGRRYERMEAAGELKVYPGRVTPAGKFLEEWFKGLLGRRARIVAIGCDRVRAAEAADALEALGLLGIPLVGRGIGTSTRGDGSHDVRAFQKWVKSGRLQHAPSILMESAIAQSDVRRDGNGNPALDKSKQRDRIDALQAAVIAVGMADAAPRVRTQAWAAVG